MKTENMTDDDLLTNTQNDSEIVRMKREDEGIKCCINRHQCNNDSPVYRIAILRK